MKIYVASSWRNTHQPGVVERLRAEGHEVYDFKNPAPGDHGFGTTGGGGRVPRLPRLDQTERDIRRRFR